MLSGNLVRNEIEQLRNNGVSIHGHPEEHASSAKFGWLLGKHAECTLAEYLGKRVSWDAIRMSPQDIEGEDVDVIADLGDNYCFQVKSLNFFASDNFGQKMVNTVDTVSDRVKTVTSGNVGYWATCGEKNQVGYREVPTDTASVGRIEFQLSHFGHSTLYKKLRSIIRKASYQLDVRNQGRRRNIAVVDTRYFHAVGDQTYYNMIEDILSDSEYVSSLDAVFLISHDFFNSKNKKAKIKIVPIASPHSDRRISAEIVDEFPIQLYTAKPFVLPINIHLNKGWNTVFEIDNGTLKVENIPIFDMF